jgi:hypothetical protein
LVGLRVCRFVGTYVGGKFEGFGENGIELGVMLGTSEGKLVINGFGGADMTLEGRDV